MIFREMAGTRVRAEKVHDPRTFYHTRIKDELKRILEDCWKETRVCSQELPWTNLGQWERQTKENNGLQLTGLQENHKPTLT